MSAVKVLGKNVFIEHLRWLLFNHVLVSEFLKKKVSGEIAFDLISLFHIQIQEPTRSSTSMRAKILFQELLSQNI